MKITNKELKQMINETIKEEMEESDELRFEWVSELIEYLQEIKHTDGDLSVINKSKDLLSVKKKGDKLIFF